MDPTVFVLGITAALGMYLNQDGKNPRVTEDPVKVARRPQDPRKYPFKDVNRSRKVNADVQDELDSMYDRSYDTVKTNIVHPRTDEMYNEVEAQLNQARDQGEVPTMNSSSNKLSSQFGGLRSGVDNMIDNMAVWNSTPVHDSIDNQGERSRYNNLYGHNELVFGTPGKPWHNNTVPFIKKVTQNTGLYDDRQNPRLEHFTGNFDHSGGWHRHKREQPAMFEPEMNRNYVFGAPNTSHGDRDLTRYNVSGKLNNVNITPFQERYVGPSRAGGPGVKAEGGFHPRTRYLPVNVNEYRLHQFPNRIIPGKQLNDAPTLVASQFKNRPDRYWTNELDFGDQGDTAEHGQPGSMRPALSHIGTVRGSGQFTDQYHIRPTFVVKPTKREYMANATNGKTCNNAAGFLNDGRAIEYESRCLEDPTNGGFNYAQSRADVPDVNMGPPTQGYGKGHHQVATQMIGDKIQNYEDLYARSSGAHAVTAGSNGRDGGYTIFQAGYQNFNTDREEIADRTTDDLNILAPAVNGGEGGYVHAYDPKDYRISRGYTQRNTYNSDRNGGISGQVGMTRGVTDTAIGSDDFTGRNTGMQGVQAANAF